MTLAVLVIPKLFNALFPISKPINSEHRLTFLGKILKLGILCFGERETQNSLNLIVMMKSREFSKLTGLET